EALGGKAALGEKLDALFGESSEVYGPSFLHDVSGLIGQYAHGNEPSHHIAYFYRFSDRPERTEQIVRKICTGLYNDTPDGDCGNDDAGAMASWYVFSAMGFYPFDPCGGEYIVGAPQVCGATLNLPNGNVFRISTSGFAGDGRPVRRVTLNGRELSDWKFSHAELTAGGELKFEF
ncbi:MAG: glycoside hydrolase family 92 protein, partial [Kiritimatiellae bacterium]|nr:glycoside hydrolase family 92 protein [Kiritimatiellia bacterium]